MVRKSRQVTRVFLLHHDSVYLMLRVNTEKEKANFPNRWIAPGGSVENGESCEECAIRELKEETGLMLEPGNLKPLLTKYDPLYNVEMVYYTTRRWVGKPCIAEVDKFSNSGWFKLENLIGVSNIGSAHIGVYTDLAAQLVLDGCI